MAEEAAGRRTDGTILFPEYLQFGECITINDTVIDY